MPRAATIQTNFTAGEISPSLRGRVDINRYQNGAKRLKNFIVKPQGGVFRRQGTIHVVEVKDSSKLTILVEFEYSDIQSYVLEFGHQYIRFIKDGAQIVSGTPVEVVSPYQESELRDLVFAQSADILYITHPAHEPRQLERLSDTSWQLVLYQNLDGPYLPQNDTDTSLRISNVVDRAHLINDVAEFAAGDVGKYVEYKQSGLPVIALVISNINANDNEVEPKDNIIAPVDPTAVLSHAAGVITSTVAIFSNNNVGSYIKVAGNWYLITGYTDTTHVNVGAALTMVATTGNIIIQGREITADVTASADVFVASDTDRLIRFNFSSQQVWGIITGYTNAKNVGVTLDRPLPLKVRDPSAFIDDGVTTLWRLGAWSASTGYPSCVTFHEERLCFAASPFQPQTVWMSRSGDYQNHAPTDTDSKVLDDSGITFTIASSKVNAIKWLSSGPTLVIGTFGAEWQVRASAISEPITPTNISIVQHTTYGSGRVRPIRVGSAVLFMQRNARKIRELLYDYQSDSLVAKDITIINEHILRRGVKAIAVAYQQEPNNIYWAALQDGSLAALTYVRDQEVYAWHPHYIGGSNVFVESVACVSNQVGNEDSLYMVVKRTINGVTKRYIEYLSEEVEPANVDDKDNYVFVDSAKKYSGAAISTMTGLSHLEGESVQIFADGSTRAPKVVAAGQVAIDGGAAQKVVVGLGYSSLLETLAPEGGNPLGTAQGKLKRPDHAVVRILNSLGLSFGPNESSLTPYSFRIGNSNMNMSPQLRSDDIVLTMDNTYDRQGSIVVAQTNPVPLNVLAVMLDYNTATTS